jgi:trimeric autotransporter adhesin
MASTINAKTTGVGGIDASGDASGVLALQTGGTTAVTIDASQNVGIGGNSSSAKLKVSGSTANSLANLGTEDAATCVVTNNDVGGLNRLSKTLYEIANIPIASVSGVYTNFNGSNDIGGALVFSTQTNAAGGVVERMRIDSSGNVGIGTSSPSQKLDIRIAGSASTTTNVLGVYNSTNGSVVGAAIKLGYPLDNYGTRIVSSQNAGATYGGSLSFEYGNGTGYTESMRIDSSGNVLVGASSQWSGFVGNAKQYVESSVSDYAVSFRSTATTAYGLAISYSTAPNLSGQNFIDARDSSAQRFAVKSNGGIANFSANNVNLSDKRLKKDITPSKSYLDTICSIPVVTFKYNDQTDEELNLGVIAQEVDKVAPELIDHNGFGEAPEGETPYLAVYQTDLQYALMKSIQELKAIIDLQQTQITALNAKVGI